MSAIATGHEAIEASHVANRTRIIADMTNLLDDILQQPGALSGLRKFYASPGAIPSKGLKGLTASWPPTVVFTGMGASLFAAFPAQAYLSEQGIRALVWETAELVHHHLKILGPDTLLVVISQSGQTAEVLQLLKSLPAEARAIAVTNVESSPLAKCTSLLLPMMAGGQGHVSTKTYMCSVAVLMYLAFAIAGEASTSVTQEIMKAVEAQEKVLDRHTILMPPIVEFFNRPPYVALMSRGADLATAYESALILKEVARIAAEPISAAQFRHGPMEIISPSHRYVLFARDGKTGNLLLKLARDISKSNGRVLLFSDLPFDDPMNIRLVSLDPIRLGLGTLVDSIYMQLLAHDVAVRAGLNPGKLEIAEGVTTEE